MVDSLCHGRFPLPWSVPFAAVKKENGRGAVFLPYFFQLFCHGANEFPIFQELLNGFDPEQIVIIAHDPSKNGLDGSVGH